MESDARYSIRSGTEKYAPLLNDWCYPYSGKISRVLDAGVYTIEVISHAKNTPGSSYTLFLSLQKRLRTQFILPPDDYFDTHKVEIMILDSTYSYVFDEYPHRTTKISEALTSSQISTLKTTGLEVLILIDDIYTLPYHFGNVNAIGTTYCDVPKSIIIDKEDSLVEVPVIDLSSLPHITFQKVNKTVFEINNAYDDAQEHADEGSENGTLS